MTESSLRRIAAFAALGLAGCGELTVGLDLDAASDREVRVLSWWGSSQSSLNYYRGLGDALSETTRLHLLPVGIEGVREAAGLSPGDNSPRAHKGAIAHLLLEEDEQSWPDAFLTNDGYDVRRWTPCGGMDPPLLVPLGSFFDPDWLERTFPKELLDVVRCELDGEIYALPLSMHRINHVVYNRDQLAQAGLGDAAADVLSLEDLKEAAQRLSGLMQPERASDSATTRPVFALPSVEPGTFRVTFLDNLVRASMPRKYEHLWRGEAEWSELDAALQSIASWKPWLSQYVELQSQALNHVLDPEASPLLVMGDWVMSNLTEEDREQVGSMGFPGLQDRFVYGLDVFAVPAKSDPSRGLLWLEAIAAREAQSRFAAESVAWPVRSDLMRDALREDPPYEPEYERLIFESEAGPSREVVRRAFRQLVGEGSGGDSGVARPAFLALTPGNGVFQKLPEALQGWYWSGFCGGHGVFEQTRYEHRRSRDPSLPPVGPHQSCP